MTHAYRSKAIALAFRGFDADPEFVQQLIGVKASSLGRAGRPVRPGVSTILKRSFVEFSIDFENEIRIDEMVPKLLAYLGGIDHVVGIRQAITPEFLEINILLPIKHSDEQESGFFPIDVIASMFEMRCSLSFEFI